MSSVNSEKCFLVVNTACLGDVLLCNSLVQNIKNIYPDSKVVFIADKSMRDAALYQEGVDEVVVFDKKGEQKEFIGIAKFILDFKYKNPDITFITYHNERNYMIAKLLGSKKILMASNKTIDLPVQKRHNCLLKNIAKEKIKNYPILYNVSEQACESAKNLLNGLDNYVTVSLTSKKDEKDVPFGDCVDLIRKFNEDNIPVVFTGVGEKAESYAEKLAVCQCEVINLVNKTTIPELAAVIKHGKLLISVDTGTMHLGTALKVPVLAIWYENNTKSLWTPDKNLYNITVVDENQNAENIYNSVLKILNQEKLNV